jgi:hypothetical protein
MEALMSLVQWCSLMALLSAATAPSPAPPRERGAVEISAGPFSLTVKPGDLSAEIGREWTGKRWLDDYASYVNSSATRSHMVGRSRQVAFSHEEARQLACIDAARQMYDRMRGRLHPRLTQADERARVVQGIAQELMGGRGLLDYHSTQAHKYGEEVWTQAVLVDASDRRLASMAERFNATVRERRANFAQTAASVAGLVVLICLTYGLVNAWTKGYVRGRLRAGAVLGMVAGVWVLIRLADLAP